MESGNSRKELRDKYDLYQEAGILEYWVLFPSGQVLQRYVLNREGLYEAQRPDVEGDTVGIHFLPRFDLNVGEIFEA